MTIRDILPVALALIVVSMYPTLLGVTLAVVIGIGCAVVMT